MVDGLVTFAFTDIEGSTARWERDPVAMQDAVRRHDAILRAAIGERGGNVFKTMGDAFFSAFARPHDAVSAMLAAQRALAAEDFSAVDGLRVRAAIHTGTADERDGDYFGTEVNRVARLLAIGHGGQILLTDETAAQLPGAVILSEGARREGRAATLRDLGAYHLKDFTEPQRVYQLIAAGLPAEFPPLRSLGTLPSDISIVDSQEFFPVAGFSGRDEELAAVHAALGHDGSIAAVHGLGGVGKSSIAREYGWRNRDAYSVIWWLGAQSEDGVIEGLLGLGAMFVQGLDQLADRRAAAKRVVNSVLSGFDKPVLLVFDNLEDERLVRSWLPRTGARALVTSRNTAWAADVTPIPLHAWELDTAIGYLQRESGRADLSEADARAIAQALGALPLALAHAAASLRNLRMVSVARYLEHIGEHLKNAPRGAEYPRSVFATFSTSIAQAEHQAAGAAAMLCFAASFAPDAIPDELFRQPLEAYAADLKPTLSEGAALDLHSVVTDGLQLDEALGALDQLSLLTFSESSRTYGMHRLVQLAARDLVGSTSQDWSECAVGVVDAAFPEVEFERWPQCGRLLPHALAVLGALPDETAFLPAASLAHRSGFYLEWRGEFSTAEELCKRALAIREKALGPEHPNVADSLSNLALGYREQARYEEAEPLYKRARAIREKALGLEHPDFAHSLNNLAHVYWCQGRNEEALPLYQRALAIREKALGPEHPLVADSLNNLANVHDDQGRYEEAEPLYQRALAILEKALGPEHPDVAVCLHNLANVRTEQERFGEAEPLYQRALAIKETALGPEHPDVASSLNGLAEVYHDQGRYDEAEALQRRALAISEKALGPDHPDVAESLNGLADVYREQGRYEEAEPLYQRALAIREKALGREHPDVATLLSDWAKLCEAQGRREDAEPLYVRALSIREESLGPDHPKTKAVREQLASLRSLLDSAGAKSAN
jgi:class 3 adenylate cyclase/tetratricopeptide (TPR) repeat protein